MRHPAALTLAAAVAAVLLSAQAGIAADKEAHSVLDFKVKDIDGQEVDLAKFKGDVLLIVNTASKCGLTPQYESLQSLHETYKDKGFQVLAFPANEFGQQEPGSDAEIKTFCKVNYDVSFPVFSKIVVKGEGIHPLYQFLTSEKTNPGNAGVIPWNFTKFLVDREGKVIARFEPKVTPDSPQVVKAIESALASGR
jgi:glutathione peroxidase